MQTTSIQELYRSIQIQVLILFAKLKTIDGDFQCNNETLDLAYNLASKKELTQFYIRNTKSTIRHLQ